MSEPAPPDPTSAADPTVGPPPRPADLPETAGRLSAGEVAALRSEQRRRWQQGDRVRVEAFLERDPRLRDDPEALLDLIYNEFLLCSEEGPPPRSEDFQHRFP